MGKLQRLNEKLVRNKVGYVYEMEEVDAILGGLTPTEVLNRVSEGDFKVKDGYFIINGRGNLTSYETITELEILYGDVK